MHTTKETHESIKLHLTGKSMSLYSVLFTGSIKHNYIFITLLT